jgi:hypothetical protein
MNQVKQRVAFRKPTVISRNVTAITFNKENEQVESVNNYTLKDGKVIAFNGRETPTRGRELTILEQLLGNVGRGSMLPRDDESVPATAPATSGRSAALPSLGGGKEGRIKNAPEIALRGAFVFRPTET